MMILDRTQIAQRLPHAGAMCLLDRVEVFDDVMIRCGARLRADEAHVLASSNYVTHKAQPEFNGVSIVHAVEYAAQAAALHISLSAEAAARDSADGLASNLDDSPVNNQPQSGVLALVKNMQTNTDWLLPPRKYADELEDVELVVETTQLLAKGNSWIYQFSLSMAANHAGNMATGRFTVVGTGDAGRAKASIPTGNV